MRRRATSILPKGLGHVRNYYFFYPERRRGNIAAAFDVLVAAEYQVKKASAADHFTFFGTDDGELNRSNDAGIVETYFRFVDFQNLDDMIATDYPIALADLYDLFVPAAICNTFNFQRHPVSRSTLRLFRSEAMNAWNDVTAAA